MILYDIDIILLHNTIKFMVNRQLAEFSLTNLLDTDLIVLSYIESSYLAYIKTINKYIYSIITQYFPKKNELPVTKELMRINNFVEHNFNNFANHICMYTSHLLLEPDLSNTNIISMPHIISDSNNRNWKLNKNKNWILNKNKNWILNKCVEYGCDLEKIKWLINKGCCPTCDTFKCAALNGNLENMKWMFLNDFPKDERTFANAALNGNLENMKWMFLDNFPKDKITYILFFRKYEMDGY